MTRQNIGIGSSANDGSGDTLRAAGQKINENFVEIYQRLGGDSDILSAQVSLVDSAIIFEGTGIDDYETRLEVANPTADRTITFPNATGNIVLDTTSQTLTNKTLTSPFLTTPQIDDTSADHQYIFAPSELAADRTVTLPLLTTDDTFVFADHTETLSNKTLSNPEINTPVLVGNIIDSSGHEILTLSTVGSAANNITITNATGDPGIAVAGSSTNVSLNLSSKGTGAVKIQTKLAYNSETFTAASGVVSVAVPLTVFSRVTNIAADLPDGTITGESKKFVNINTGVTTVEPTTFAQGTSFTLQQYGAVEAIWVNSVGWHLLGFDSSSTQYITIT